MIKYLVPDLSEDRDHAPHVRDGEDRVEHLTLLPVLFAYMTIRQCEGAQNGALATYPMTQVNLVRK